MERASAARLRDGRLHMHHGPIDLIVTIEGDGRSRAEAAMMDRFETVLEDIVEELPILRSAMNVTFTVRGVVAGRMMAATMPFLPEFITPMAAVAGAVADEMIGAVGHCGDITRVIVNNGGDVAFFLSEGQSVMADVSGTGSSLCLTAQTPWRGVATSGWRGRSWSLGIADSVTVIARSAAEADAAATMIANRVNLPEHPAIRRAPAEDLASESDLAGRLVTTAVGPLNALETERALKAGAAYARDLLRRDLIGAAILTLNGDVYHVGEVALLPHTPEREIEHA